MASTPTGLDASSTAMLSVASTDKRASVNARKVARILVVDDEAHVRSMIAATLERQGYEVMLASGGREALEAIDQDTFELILTDIVMQEGNGLALLERIHGQNPNLPVIMVTAIHDISVAIDSMRRGAYDYLLKPFEREHLVATVTEVLSGNTVNVIPTVGTVRGTLRTASLDQRTRLHEALTLAAAKAAVVRRVDHRAEIVEGYPAVVGDDDFVGALVEALRRVGLEEKLAPMAQPSMVIEDFAYFLQKWPGAMVYLGAKVGSTPSFNHSDDVLFDETVMTTGLALHALVASLDV